MGLRGGRPETTCFSPIACFPRDEKPAMFAIDCVCWVCGFVRGVVEFGLGVEIVHKRKFQF